MESKAILEQFKVKADLAESGLLYLYEKSSKFIDSKLPSLDPPPQEVDDRLAELIHRQAMITTTMSFLLDIGFRE